MYCRNKEYLGLYDVHCLMSKKIIIKTVHINTTDISVQPMVIGLAFEAGMRFVV